MALPWHLDATLTILNIYAPNAHNENQTFWETLAQKWDELNLPLPDIMLGYFNIVEDSLDQPLVFPSEATEQDRGLVPLFPRERSSFI